MVCNYLSLDYNERQRMSISVRKTLRSKWYGTEWEWDLKCERALRWKKQSLLLIHTIVTVRNGNKYIPWLNKSCKCFADEEKNTWNMLVFCGFQFEFAFVLAFYSFYVCDTICVYLPNKWTGASSILAFCPGDCNTVFRYIYNSRCSWYRWKCTRIRRTMQIYTSTFFHLDT